MKYSVVESFTINSRIGPLEFLVGKLLELTEEQAAKFGDKVRLADKASANSGWSPAPKAWLTDSGELRVQGVFPGDWPDGGLTPEIIRLTTGNMELQSTLLRRHVGAYSGPAWKHLVEHWQERAAIMEHDGGLARKQAELEAARCLRAEAFLEELKQTYLEV